MVAWALLSIKRSFPHSWPCSQTFSHPQHLWAWASLWILPRSASMPLALMWSRNMTLLTTFIPRSWIYPLSEVENKAIKDYMAEKVRQDRITWSAYHASASYFFWVDSDPASTTTDASLTQSLVFILYLNFQITFRPGSKNGKANALSRCFAPPEAIRVPESIFPSNNMAL